MEDEIDTLFKAQIQKMTHSLWENKKNKITGQLYFVSVTLEVNQSFRFKRSFLYVNLGIDCCAILTGYN